MKQLRWIPFLMVGALAATLARADVIVTTPYPYDNPPLPGAELIPGRASFYIRLLTPIAKGVQRARGNGRIRPPGERPAAATR